MAGYFLRRGNKTLGPFDLAKVKKGLASGQVLESDGIAESREGPWNLVRDFPALQSHPNAANPSPPPIPKQADSLSPQASMQQATAGGMEFRAESEYVALVHGPYDLAYQLMRDAMSKTKGKIKTDSASQGSLLAKWRYGINLFGLSVSAVMRDAGNGWTRVEVKGFFSDAVDTFGHAKKKARLVLKQFKTLVEEHSSVGSNPMPSSRPGPSAPSAQSAGSGKSYSSMATASMICGIGGLLICGPAGIVAIILGIVALNGMSSSGNNAGHGSAVTGIVLGGITILVWGLIVAANM